MNVRPIRDDEPNSNVAMEHLQEALYGNPELDNLCFEYAVKMTFKDVPRDEDVMTFFRNNPSTRDYVLYVLGEEWSTSLDPSEANNELRRRYEKLHDTYWHYRALWWYELLGTMHLRNQLEFARMASIHRDRIGWGRDDIKVRTESNQ